MGNRVSSSDDNKGYKDATIALSVLVVCVLIVIAVLFGVYSSSDQQGNLSINFVTNKKNTEIVLEDQSPVATQPGTQRLLGGGAPGPNPNPLFQGAAAPLSPFGGASQAASGLAATAAAPNGTPAYQVPPSGSEKIMSAASAVAGIAKPDSSLAQLHGATGGYTPSLSILDLPFPENATSEQRTAIMKAAAAEAWPELTGTLGAMFRHVPGPSLHYGGIMGAKGTPVEQEFSTSAPSLTPSATLALVDPVAAEKLERASEMTGLPPTFNLSEEDARRLHNQQAAYNYLTDGMVDPSLAVLEGRETSQIITRGMVYDALNMEMTPPLVPPPVRHLYRSTMEPCRGPVPSPSMGSMINANDIDPGQEYTLLSQQCADNPGAILNEPY
jgi:hypothetical protein